MKNDGVNGTGEFSAKDETGSRNDARPTDTTMTDSSTSVDLNVRSKMGFNCRVTKST